MFVRNYSNKLNSESSSSISYKVIIQKDLYEFLVIAEDENGIDYIKGPDNITISGNGKKKIAVDYKMNMNQEYPFFIKNVLGEETEQKLYVKEDGLIKKIAELQESGEYVLNCYNTQTYPIHAYVFNGDQTWDSQTFGDENDIATDSTDAKNTIVVKVNGNLTINSDAVITAFNSEYGGPKGMFLYVTGNIINNGTISMTGRGAKAEGQDVYLCSGFNETYEYIPAQADNEKRRLRKWWKRWKCMVRS